MPAGSVSVAANGTVTGSGLAMDIYTARVASIALAEPPGIIQAGPAGYPVKHGLALDANALATAFYAGGAPPTGAVLAYAGAAAPTGWLLCNGAAVSRTTYADLFAVTSTTYGVGDGATTFNLPNLLGRTAIGAGTGDAADATAHALGSKTGTETHALITAELAAHSHTVTDAGHQHDPAIGTAFLTAYGTGSLLLPGAGATAEQSGATSTETTGIVIDNAGSGTAHNNMQPSLTLNWIIKT